MKNHFGGLRGFGDNLAWCKIIYFISHGAKSQNYEP